MRFYIYDLETFRNMFSFCGMFHDSQEVFLFEISARKNERDELLAHLSDLERAGVYMVGFNNLHFDYPILDALIHEPYTFDAHKAYLEAQKIINFEYGKNPNSIPFNKRKIPQIDLSKINHFDNKARRTSLKALQCAMRSESVEDLPFDPSKDMTSEQMDILLKYNIHDVTETKNFFNHCKHLIDLRLELVANGTLQGDVLNYSDKKIGTELLVKRIGRQNCYSSPGHPRQTFRNVVPFKDIILPKIQFQTKGFQDVLGVFNSQSYEINGEAPTHVAKLADLEFKFGIGGVHASVQNKKFVSTDTHVIKDIDVSGMYPAIAIANGFYPEHLGQNFLTGYKQLWFDRRKHAKGTTMNAVLKLAANGVYGDSNNIYSPFYDPKYTFSITVNGQLQLLQLAEALSLIPGLELIQANTDGITVYLPRSVEPFFDIWCRAWEDDTGLKLEEVNYSKMFIRDVNNYLAVTDTGKVKRKGDYAFPVNDRDYDGIWNKNFSNLSAAKAAELVMLRGVSVDDALLCVTDKFDFMLRYKTTGGAKVFIGEKEMLRTTRYYVSTDGAPMFKVAPPKGEVGKFKRRNKIPDRVFNEVVRSIPEGTWDARIHTKNKSKYEEVRTAIESGRLVTECNRAGVFKWNNLDWDYYRTEVEKLLIL